MTESTEARVRARKDWLKRLAAERRSAWMIAVRPRSLDGATRIHTRSQVLHLEDGVVAGVFSAETESAVEGSPLLGMRLVGWAGDDNRLHAEFVPGTRAIFWRRERDGNHTSLALTGRVIAFGAIRAVTGSITLPAPRSASWHPHSGLRLATRA